MFDYLLPSIDRARLYPGCSFLEGVVRSSDLHIPRPVEGLGEGHDEELGWNIGV